MRFVLALLLVLLGGQAFALTPLPPQADGVPWPRREWPMADPARDVNAGRLKTLLDQALSGSVPEGTRAVLIVHRGVLVAERYAPGFGKDRRFLSQSVAKTVLGAMTGVAVHGGMLSLDGPAPVAAWRDPADPRHAITLRHLLRMTDGLDFNEAYFNPVTSNVLPMLFGGERGDMAAFAAGRPLSAKPGTRWAYSSGTANLVSGLVRDAVGGTRGRYLAFMRGALFDPIGMTSAEPEFDESGTFVGSSWLHATARDWARFGLLMLRGGVWDGHPILPEGWVDFMRTPQPNGVYGAMTWLNAGTPRRVPNAPPDLFMATGHRGQVIAMVPSKDLVIVRFGRTGYAGYDAMYRWMGEVVAVFPEVRPTP
jgi:CubicO group peptidase (beta-lactamase class C family)